MRSETDTRSDTISIMEQEPIKNPSSLHKTYFNDSALSDLTIKLSDRSVHVHRIVLCRGSEHFAKQLLEDGQDAQSKEIVLGDDSGAMTAVLRHLYGLPYALDMAEWHDGITVLPHVLVYITARKYRATALQSEASQNIQNILDDNVKGGKPLLELTDFLDALREIITGTAAGDTLARETLVMHCVRHVSLLRKEDAFMALLRDLAELGAEIIERQGTTAMNFTLEDLDFDVDDVDMDREYFPEADEDEGSEGGENACECCGTIFEMPILCSPCCQTARPKKGDGL